MPVLSPRSAGKPCLLSITAGPEAIARLADPRIKAGPFQQLGWIAPFAEADPAAMLRLHLVEWGEPSQSMLIPLDLRRLGPFRIADIFGGKHASFHLPALIGDFSTSAECIRAALVEVGQRLGIDAFTFTDTPASHAGLANPLVVLSQQESPSSGWSTPLEPDIEAMLERRSDRDDRRKLRQKINRLAALGPIRSGWVTDPAEQDAVWSALFTWKSQRFGDVGIIDPFESAETQAFFRQASRLASPVIRLFAVHCGDRLVAAMAGAYTPHTFSSMLNGHDSTPEIARNSPGEQLIAALIPMLAAEGCQSFDLGVGEAHYKARYCPDRIPLVDIGLGVSCAGKVLARIFLLKRALKRRVKQDERLSGLVIRGRRFFRR